MKIADACGYPPGHFYSPIPSLPEVSQKADVLFDENRPVQNIDFNCQEQFHLLQEFTQYYDEMPGFFKEHNYDLRYKLWDETFGYAQYRYADVVFLYSLMRHFRPKRIIEVGSGFSSAVMLDVNEIFFQNNIHLTFIEPYPQRLLALLDEADKQNSLIIKSPVQDVNKSVFDSLQFGDFLFIDSSHIAKIGSDVNYLLFEILPLLPEGVIIHFHDILYPFEYPKSWIVDNKCFWNEAYMLRAFLMHNQAYKILAFNSFLIHHKPEWFEQHMPACLIENEYTGGIWLQKQ